MNWIERVHDVFRDCEAMAKAMTKAEWSVGRQDVTLHWDRHCTKRGFVTIMFRVLSIRKHASIQRISTHPLSTSEMRLQVFELRNVDPGPNFSDLGSSCSLTFKYLADDASKM